MATCAPSATLHWHISNLDTSGPIVVVPSFDDDNIPAGTYYGKVTIGNMTYEFVPLPNPPPNESGPGQLTYHLDMTNDNNVGTAYALQIGSFT
jgi:hypothetical protein